MNLDKIDVTKIKQLVTRGVNDPEDGLQVTIIFKDDSRYTFEPMCEAFALELHNAILKRIEDEIFKCETLSFSDKIRGVK